MNPKHYRRTLLDSTEEIVSNTKKAPNAILHSHGYPDHKLTDSHHDEFGYPTQKEEDLTKTEDFEPLEKAKKDMMPMFGPTPEQHHHEFADWASKSLPNKDWQVWAARNYKKDPAQFTPEAKATVEHFGGSTHMPEVAKVRFDKTHDLATGINAFQEAENAYNKRVGSKLNVVKPDAGTKKVLDVGNNMAWHSIARGGCAAEGKAMGHCGNVPSQKPGDRILSLRTEHKGANGEVFHEPHATFIVNNGYLGEMKGRGNTKPDAKYHHAVTELLTHPKIKGVVGGGYLHHQNFSVEDLKPEHKEKVLAQKPNISVYDSDEIPKDLPEKFRKEVEPVIGFKKEMKEKHGENWRKGALDAIAGGEAPSMALNAIKNPTDDELEHIIAGPNADHDSRVQAAMIGKDSNRLHSALARHSPSAISYLNNPNIDAIVSSKNSEAIEHLAANESLRPKDVDKLASHPDFGSFPDSVRADLAHNEHLDPKHHEKLVNDKNEDVRYAIASNPNLDPKHHEKLVNDLDDKVRQTIVENDKLHPNLHATLTGDTNHEIRQAIAKQPNLHPDLQAKLANDPEEGVRQAMADNPDLHPDLHGKLAGDSSGHIKQSVAKNPNLHPDLQAKLAKDKSDDVRRNLAQNPNLHPDLHAKLAKDKSDDVRRNLAQNPNLHPDLQAKLAKDKDKAVQSAMMENPSYRPANYKPEKQLGGNIKLFQNHMNRLKESDPKQHSEAQDKLVDHALESGDLDRAHFLVRSGVLDNERHAKLHDGLDDVNSGNHEHEARQSWGSNKYDEMLHDHLENANLPQGYHDEIFRRLENQGYDPSEIADQHFERNRDSFTDDAHEKADEIARNNYSQDEYMNDMEQYERGAHPLDAHIAMNRNGMPLLEEELHNRGMARLKNENKIDADGNYSDLDLEDAKAEEKDGLHQDLRAHLDGNRGKFPQKMHAELDSHQDNLYEGHDESVREGGNWDSAYDQAMDEVKDGLLEDPNNWPSHLHDTSWIKENVKPQNKDYEGSGAHGVFDEEDDEKDEEKLAASEKMGKLPAMNKSWSAKRVAQLNAKKPKTPEEIKASKEKQQKALDLAIAAMKEVSDKNTKTPSESKPDPLKKTPIEYQPSKHDKYIKQPFEPYDASAYQHVRAQPLQNGLFHHIFRYPEDNDTVHNLTDSPHPYQGNRLAEIAGEEKDGSLHVNHAGVDPNHKGKGFGKILYRLALMHHGQMNSDELVSQKAHSAWQHLKDKGADVKFGRDDTREKHSAKVSPEIKEGWDKELAASELEKGAQGDWKKEDYKISHRELPEMFRQRGIKGIEVLAHDSGGNKVGHARIAVDKKGADSFDTHVSQTHRRKGLASAMYQYAEKHIGKKLTPATLQTEDGEKLWQHGSKQQGKTKFGKAEPKNTQLEHFSPQQNLKEISPQSMGSGVDSRVKEGGRGINSAHPHSFYYRAGTKPEDVVVGSAKSKYTVEIPHEAKLFDLAGDENGIVSKLKEEAKNRSINPGVVNMDDVHSALKANGYHGFYNSKHEQYENVVGLYHSQPVKSEENI